MAEVTWPQNAIDHLESITIYIAGFDPAAAARVGSRLLGLGDSLSFFPRRRRPAAGGTREMVNVRPYVLRYEVESDQVFIISIRHAKQRTPDGPLSAPAALTPA